jgi:hypothetical protein
MYAAMEVQCLCKRVGLHDLLSASCSLQLGVLFLLGFTSTSNLSGSRAAAVDERSEQLISPYTTCNIRGCTSQKPRTSNEQRDGGW